MNPVTSIEQLKALATNEEGEFNEFFIMLGGGLLRSSKRICYFPKTKTFDVINEIDDSEQENLTEEQLKTETNIVEAIEKGAFFQY